MGLPAKEMLRVPDGGDVRIVCDDEVAAALPLHIGRFATVGQLQLDASLYACGEAALVPDPGSFAPCTAGERSQLIVSASHIAQSPLPFTHVRLHSTKESREAYISLLTQRLKNGEVCMQTKTNSPPNWPTTTLREKTRLLEGAHIDYGSKYAYRAGISLGPGNRWLLVATHSGPLLRACTGYAATADGMRELFANDRLAFETIRCLRMPLAPFDMYEAHTGLLLHDGSTMSQTLPSTMHFIHHK